MSDITGYPSRSNLIRMLSSDEQGRMQVAHQKWLTISQMPDGFAMKPYYGRVVEGRFLWTTRQEPDLHFEETYINDQGIVSVDEYFIDVDIRRRTGSTHILGELRMQDRAFLRYDPAAGRNTDRAEFLFFGTDGMIRFL